MTSVADKSSLSLSFFPPLPSLCVCVRARSGALAYMWASCVRVDLKMTLGIFLALSEYEMSTRFMSLNNWSMVGGAAWGEGIR